MAAVELALVLPLFIALVFGIVDFGVLLQQQSSVREGVREGARRAVVAEFSESNDDPSVAQCVIGRDTSNAVIDPLSESGRLICTVKRRVGLGDSVRVMIEFDQNLPGEQLTICAQTNAQSTSGFYRAIINGRSVRAKTTMRIEEAHEDLEAVAEAHASGWGWCTT